MIDEWWIVKTQRQCKCSSFLKCTICAKCVFFLLTRAESVQHSCIHYATFKGDGRLFYFLLYFDQCHATSHNLSVWGLAVIFECARRVSGVLEFSSVLSAVFLLTEGSRTVGHDKWFIAGRFVDLPDPPYVRLSGLNQWLIHKDQGNKLFQLGFKQS